MSKVNKILEEYAFKKPVYMELKDTLEYIINNVLSSNGIVVSNINFRVKSEDSLKQKIYYKNKYESIEDITDIVGCRILTLFENDIDKIEKLLSECFDIIEIVDKRKKCENDKIDFGYNSLHIIATLDSKRCKLVEYSQFTNIKFEIQLRTVLQHAWDEIEHGLGYKSIYEIPFEIRRKLSRLSASLEILDEEFEEIRNEVEDYLCNFNKKKKKSLKIEINKDSIIHYVMNSKVVRDINKEILKDFKYTNIFYDTTAISQTKMIEKLKFLGYEYIEQLDKDLIKYKKDIIKVGSVWLTEYESIDNQSINAYNILVYFIMSMLKNTFDDIDYPINKDTAENFINAYYSENSGVLQMLNKN